MEGSNLMQEMYAIGKRLEELKIFHRAMPFNNTEMQMMREIIAAKERGSRVISSGLAKLLGITRSAVSQMVKKLEDEKIIVRVPAENDKKSSHVMLSPAARTAYERMKDYMNAFVQQIVDRVGYDEIRRFIDGMNKFIDIFNEVLGAFPSIETQGLLREGKPGKEED